jgi:hypothetical protein
MLSDMPKAEEPGQRGTVRYRTIRIGKGRTKRILHIAIVRKAGPRSDRRRSAHGTEQ